MFFHANDSLVLALGHSKKIGLSNFQAAFCDWWLLKLPSDEYPWLLLMAIDIGSGDGLK